MNKRVYSLAVVAFVANSGTLGAATQRLQQTTCPALKDVLHTHTNTTLRSGLFRWTSSNNFCTTLLTIHYSSKLLVNGNLNNLRMFHFILKFLSERIHLVDVLGSCPREAAGVVTAEHVERRVVRVRPHRADHFHKHRVHVVLVPDAGLSCRSGNKSHEPCI